MSTTACGLRVGEEELRTLLVDHLDIVDTAEFDRACAVARRLGVPLERALTERGRVPFDFLLQQLAHAWGVGFVDLKLEDVTSAALTLVSEEFARRHMLVPIRLVEQGLEVAMMDPRDRLAIDMIERRARVRVVPLLAASTQVARAHLLYKGDLRAMLERTLANDAVKVNGARTPGGDDRPAAELLERILEYAAAARASDIHIEPYELEGLVRCRVDGVLHEVLSLSPAAMPALVARIKVLSRMRIDERRVPQDGRFDVDLGGFKLDLRVSTLPTHWGEKVVLRVLAKECSLADLEDLGLVHGDLEIVRRNILRPFGMVLVTGPTGSGKSTTLYSMLTRIGAERQNVVSISTIEDPIENTFPRITQTQVSAMSGVEFATGLRALLRQDPDVVMIGEIRDRDTVEIAVRAALVGRLLLSTLHTNDATGTVPRLLDMGVEPFLVASTLALAIGQRLVRRICTDCRESVPAEEMLVRTLRRRPDFDAIVQVLQRTGVLSTGGNPFAAVRVFRGKGCGHCGGRGFRGRLGVFELFELTDEIRAMVMDRADAASIRQAVIARGMKTMFQDGLAKMLLGETTLEEVFRVAV